MSAIVPTAPAASPSPTHYPAATWLPATPRIPYQPGVLGERYAGQVTATATATPFPTGNDPQPEDGAASAPDNAHSGDTALPVAHLGLLLAGLGALLGVLRLLVRP